MAVHTTVVTEPSFHSALPPLPHSSPNWYQNAERTLEYAAILCHPHTLLESQRWGVDVDGWHGERERGRKREEPARRRLRKVGSTRDIDPTCSGQMVARCCLQILRPDIGRIFTPTWIGRRKSRCLIGHYSAVFVGWHLLVCMIIPLPPRLSIFCHQCELRQIASGK